MLLLLLGCQDQNLSKLSDAEIGILPIIEVSPPVLAFGEYIDQPIVRNLTITNVGEASLDISSIVIQGDEAISFTNQSGLTQLSIEPSEMPRCHLSLSRSRSKTMQPYRLGAMISILPSLKFR